MKVNQVGTLVIIGVVASFAAACSGNPTKPSAALSPILGDAGSSVAVDVLSSIPSAPQTCAAARARFDGTEDQTGEVPSPETSPVTCDSPVGSETPGDVVVQEPPAMESVRHARR